MKKVGYSLTTGEIAKVVFPNEGKIAYPIVNIVTEKDGTPLDKMDCKLIDLAEEEKIKVNHVLDNRKKKIGMAIGF